MNEKIVERFLDSPGTALHILGSSFEQFIRFFHWYIYHQEFIFKPFHMTIIHKLEDIAFGRSKKRNLMINIPPRFGKLLADDTPVLTREGWKKHGDLKVGDYVVGLDGEFKKVLAVSPKAPANCCVEFSDGDKIYCHENHEWVIDAHPTRERIIRETKWFNTIKMYSGPKENVRGHRYEYQLPMFNGVKGEVKCLPVQPYSLGAWLGDGTNVKPCITGDKNDYKIIDKMKLDGYNNHKIFVHKTTGVYTYYFDNLRKALNNAGLCYWNKTVRKFIPDVYFSASESQRLELLAGLLDTDGHLTKDENRYHFTTAEETLKDSFIKLVSTFGWRVNVIKQEPRLSSSGIMGKHAYWVISFNPDRYIPCQLERKQLTTFSKKRKIGFKSVTQGDFGKIGNCIEVEGGIYLAGYKMKPTHNSSIMKYFCAWSYMLNPASNCIYTSYSDELATSFSKDIREIVTSEAFVKFTGIKLNKAKIGADYWATEAGGGFRAAPLGGSLTGFGCFSYGTKVLTEFGPRKIGDIIEEEQHIKIASLNKKTHNIEYKYPSRWIKNQKQEFLRIITNDGLIINCSTDHKFYTDKGIVRADELTTDSILPSNPLYHIPFYSKFFGYFTKRMVFIADKISLFLCGNVFVDRNSLTQDTDTLRFSSPINTTFNITNVVSSDSVVLRYFKITSRVCRNLFNIFYGKFMVPVVGSVSNAILFVIRLSSISKIFNKVILWVSVKMANTKPFFSWTKKGFCNKCVNGSVLSNSFLRKVCNKIALLTCPKRNKSVCSDASHSPYRRNLIKPFIFWNRKPLFIYRIGHYTSYCFTIPSNHNLFLCGSQELLVRNCGISGEEYGGCALIDDPLKASNVKSQAEMQNSIDYYLNTLKSRANNQAKTPFILIMQRLALEDLAGYIIENEKEDWDIVKIPALNEDTGEALWPERFSAKDLLKLKKLSPFVYYGQYQQEPIVVGGSVFKTEWFKYYNPEQFYEYQSSFITSDTAQKKAESNDFTVFSWWGKTVDNKLHLLDMTWGKFDAHELKQQVKLFWEKCCNDKRAVQPYAFYIEEKGSGIGVIQELVKTYPLPLLPIMRNRYKNNQGMWVSMDKFSRAMTTVPYIANGWVYLPKDEKCDISNTLLAEAAAFKADLTHKHDDKIDTLCDAVEIAFGASSISSIFI